MHEISCIRKNCLLNLDDKGKILNNTNGMTKYHNIISRFLEELDELSAIMENIYDENITEALKDFYITKFDENIVKNLMHEKI